MLYNESIEVLKEWTFEELEERRVHCEKYGFIDDLNHVEKAIAAKEADCIEKYPSLRYLECDNHTKAIISTILMEMNKNLSEPVYDKLNVFGENIVKYLIKMSIIKPMVAINSKCGDRYNKYRYLPEDVCVKCEDLKNEICYKYYKLMEEPTLSI